MLVLVTPDADEPEEPDEPDEPEEPDEPDELDPDDDELPLEVLLDEEDDELLLVFVDPVAPVDEVEPLAFVEPELPVAVGALADGAGVEVVDSVLSVVPAVVSLLDASLVTGALVNAVVPLPALA